MSVCICVPIFVAKNCYDILYRSMYPGTSIRLEVPAFFFRLAAPNSKEQPRDSPLTSENTSHGRNEPSFQMPVPNLVDFFFCGQEFQMIGNLFSVDGVPRYLFRVALRDATKTPLVTPVSRRGSTSDKVRLLFVLSPERRPCWLILKNSIYGVEDNLLGSPRPCYASRSLTIESIRPVPTSVLYHILTTSNSETPPRTSTVSRTSPSLVPFLGTYPPKQSQADVWSEFRILADPTTHEATKKREIEKMSISPSVAVLFLLILPSQSMLVPTPLIGRNQTPGQQTRPGATQSPAFETAPNQHKTDSSRHTTIRPNAKSSSQRALVVGPGPMEGVRSVDLMSAYVVLALSYVFSFSARSHPQFINAISPSSLA